MRRLFSSLLVAATLSVGAVSIVDHCVSFAQGYVEGMNTFNVNNFGSDLSCEVYQAVYANALNRCRGNNPQQ